jgi:hypothetical protein
LVLPLLSLPTFAANFLRPKLIRILSDFFHSFPPIKQSRFHLLVVVILPLIGGEFGVPEGIRGEWQKAVREWIYERIGEPKSEKRKIKGRSLRTV